MNKAEKLAEEYVFHQQNEAKRCCDDCNIKFINANVYVTRAFLAGWNARDQDLRESSEEFDEKLFNEYCEGYAIIRQGPPTREECARYQHSQDQLKYQALFSAYSKLDNINIELNHRIMDLKAEIENSNKFAQDQENQINTLAFEKTKEAQAYVLKIQELEALIKDQGLLVQQLTEFNVKAEREIVGLKEKRKEKVSLDVVLIADLYQEEIKDLKAELAKMKEGK